MTNSSIKSYNVGNFYDCYDQCKQDGKCRSVNYYVQKALCQHNSLKISDKPENKMEDENSVYMENHDATGKCITIRDNDILQNANTQLYCI